MTRNQQHQKLMEKMHVFLRHSLGVLRITDLSGDDKGAVTI
jgi:hypothetical protein